MNFKVPSLAQMELHPVAEGMIPAGAVPGLWGGQRCIPAPGGAEEGEGALPAPQGCSLTLCVPLVAVPEPELPFPGQTDCPGVLQTFPT